MNLNSDALQENIPLIRLSCSSLSKMFQSSHGTCLHIGNSRPFQPTHFEHDHYRHHQHPFSTLLSSVVVHIFRSSESDLVDKNSLHVHFYVRAVILDHRQDQHPCLHAISRLQRERDGGLRYLNFKNLLIHNSKLVYLHWPREMIIQWGSNVDV